LFLPLFPFFQRVKVPFKRWNFPLNEKNIGKQRSLLLILSNLTAKNSKFENYFPFY